MISLKRTTIIIVQIGIALLKIIPLTMSYLTVQRMYLFNVIHFQVGILLIENNGFSNELHVYTNNAVSKNNYIHKFSTWLKKSC